MPNHTSSIDFPGEAAHKTPLKRLLKQVHLIPKQPAKISISTCTHSQTRTKVRQCGLISGTQGFWGSSMWLSQDRKAAKAAISCLPALWNVQSIPDKIEFHFWWLCKEILAKFSFSMKKESNICQKPSRWARIYHLFALFFSFSLITLKNTIFSIFTKFCSFIFVLQ